MREGDREGCREEEQEAKRQERWEWERRGRIHSIDTKMIRKQEF